MRLIEGAVENRGTMFGGLRLQEIGHDKTVATHQLSSHRAIANSGNCRPRNLAAYVSLGTGARRDVWNEHKIPVGMMGYLNPSSPILVRRSFIQPTRDRYVLQDREG